MVRIVAIKATYASPHVAKSESDDFQPVRYTFWMLSGWLHEALETSGYTQAQIARLVSAIVGRSIDRAAVNKMLAGKRSIAGDELKAIESITKLEAPTEIQVPLKGRVGAGQAVYPIDDGENETVPAPRDSRPGTVAVEVSGESMFPAYENGTLLYYSRLLPASEMQNRRAVVKLADGRMLVKIIRRGSTHFTWTLSSINAQFPDIEDAVVDWAAPIDWIKPR